MARSEGQDRELRTAVEAVCRSLIPNPPRLDARLRRIELLDRPTDCRDTARCRRWWRAGESLAQTGCRAP